MGSSLETAFILLRCPWKVGLYKHMLTPTDLHVGEEVYLWKGQDRQNTCIHN